MKEPFGKLESGDNKAGFVPSDLPQFPPEYLKLMRYIMRHHPITYTKLQSDMKTLPPEDAVSLDDLQEMLDVLVQEGHLQKEHEGSDLAYRAQIRRQAPRNATMQSIWSVLDAHETTGLSPETAINPELRRVRSALVDSLLADLSKLSVTASTPTPTPDTEGTARSLMNDLLATGRSSMARRSGMAPTPEPQEKKPANADLSGHSSPDKQPKDSTGSTDKLRDLFGKRKSS